MDCKYCYNKTRETLGKMSIKTVEEIMCQILEYNNGRTSTFGWHGGEPLLMGLDFFEDIIEVQNESSKNIKNYIQTNATLLDDDFAHFFKRNNFGVRISLDGPKDIHDMNRVFRNGSGSFMRVMESVSLIREKKIDLACSVVLTKSSTDRIDDIYKFFKSEGINFSVNPIFPDRRYREEMLTPEEFGNSLIRLFDLWYSDFDIGSKIMVRPLSSFVKGVVIPTCINETNCHRRHITINTGGHVFPCQRFIGLEGFDFGTIFERTITEILNSEEYSKLERLPEKIKECAGCKWLRICNGGCMYYAYAGNGSIYARDYYCAARKMLFEHISKKLNIST